MPTCALTGRQADRQIESLADYDDYDDEDDDYEIWLGPRETEREDVVGDFVWERAPLEREPHKTRPPLSDRTMAEP